ncbi:uncharacterized protein EKO05_0003497 [Ascochyta rabiei]|nr:uncharacterized protein EKO05_0003497 [Ascochyta rabiei]UPX12967.1 hypothetical protein EKO05_0003497 [Ascochyta rabiei]
MMAFELRSAYKDKVEGVDPKRVQDLADTKNPRSPYRRYQGRPDVRMARPLSIIRQTRVGPQPRQTRVDVAVVLGSARRDTRRFFWTGVKAEFAMAEKDFEAKQAQEGEKASFQTLVHKDRAQGTADATQKSGNDRKKGRWRAESSCGEAHGAAQGTGHASGQGNSTTERKAKLKPLSQSDKTELVEAKTATATTASHQLSRVILESDYEPLLGALPRPSQIPASHKLNPRHMWCLMTIWTWKKPILCVYGSYAQLHGAPFEIGAAPGFTH